MLSLIPAMEICPIYPSESSRRGHSFTVFLNNSSQLAKVDVSIILSLKRIVVTIYEIPNICSKSTIKALKAGVKYIQS